jgi:PAS domain S-box-containing protein
MRALPLHPSKWTIYITIGAIILVAVVLTMSFHSYHVYTTTKRDIDGEINKRARQSILLLEQNLDDFILSYAVNEYDKLVANELVRVQGFAIIVSDYNMGKVVGDSAYKSGKIQHPQNGVIDYDPESASHELLLSECYYSDRGVITGPDGEAIGAIDLYISDNEIQTKLREIMLAGIQNGLAITLFLIILLFTLIHLWLLKPLINIIQALKIINEDGLPGGHVPQAGPKEIITLADTINNMVGAIRKSRVLLERKHNDLQLEKERLANILEGTRAGEWEWNIQTGETTFNMRWAEIVGYTLEELAPVSIKTWIELAHPDDMEQSNRLLEKHFSGELEYYEHESRMLHKSGRWVWVLDRGKIISWSQDGKPLLMAGTHSEITRSKEAEASLIVAKENAEVASQAKSEFLAVMSHEIRTPLNAILGMAEVVQETDLDPSQSRSMEVLCRSGNNMLSLIEDILDFAQVESGRMTLDKKPVDLQQLANEAIEVHTLSANRKGLDLNCRIDSEAPNWFGGDPKRVRQILLNLLGNAVKFTERGSIGLHISCASPQALHFAVSDTGIGISGDEQKLIFDPFTQSDSSSTRQHGGIGLGLSLCFRLAETMGGEIWVESELGKGSVFHFSIPLTTDDLNPEQPSPQSKISTDNHPEEKKQETGNGISILLAEDIEENVIVIEAYLKKTPHHVDTVEDGEQAVEKIQSGKRYDLILMDIQMPGIDGFEATRKIRTWEEEQGSPRTPILALTAHAMTGDKEKSLAVGCDGHVTKPVTKQKLLDVIYRFTK